MESMNNPDLIILVSLPFDFLQKKLRRPPVQSMAEITEGLPGS